MVGESRWHRINDGGWAGGTRSVVGNRQIIADDTAADDGGWTTLLNGQVGLALSVGSMLCRHRIEAMRGNGYVVDHSAVASERCRNLEHDGERLLRPGRQFGERAADCAGRFRQAFRRAALRAEHEVAADE